MFQMAILLQSCVAAPKTRYASTSGMDRHTLWEANLAEKEITADQTIESGGWNAIAMNFPGVKPDSLGYMSLTLSFESAILKIQKN